MELDKGLGTVEYTANGKTMVLYVQSMHMEPPGFRLVLQGRPKPKAVAALHEASAITMTMVSASGARVWSKVISMDLSEAVACGKRLYNMHTEQLIGFI